MAAPARRVFIRAAPVLLRKLQSGSKCKSNPERRVCNPLFSALAGG